MVLDASLLNTQHYKVRIKGKVEQSREGVAPSPTPWCSSYRKGCLRVTLDYGRQLYFLLSYGQNKGFGLKFCGLSNLIWNALRKKHWLKHCEYNKEDNSVNILVKFIKLHLRNLDKLFIKLGLVVTCIGHLVSIKLTNNSLLNLTPHEMSCLYRITYLWIYVALMCKSLYRNTIRLPFR